MPRWAGGCKRKVEEWKDIWVVLFYKPSFFFPLRLSGFCFCSFSKHLLEFIIFLQNIITVALQWFLVLFDNSPFVCVMFLPHGWTLLTLGQRPKENVPLKTYYSPPCSHTSLARQSYLLFSILTAIFTPSLCLPSLADRTSLYMRLARMIQHATRATVMILGHIRGEVIWH